MILVDTKYEFGKIDDTIYLMDEIHTPDSSRYFYADGFEQRQENGEKQKQLSKEFVREWLIANNFMEVICIHGKALRSFEPELTKKRSVISAIAVRSTEGHATINSFTCCEVVFLVPPQNEIKRRPYPDKRMTWFFAQIELQ